MWEQEGDPTHPSTRCSSPGCSPEAGGATHAARRPAWRLCCSPRPGACPCATQLAPHHTSTSICNYTLAKLLLLQACIGDCCCMCLAGFRSQQQHQCICQTCVIRAIASRSGDKHVPCTGLPSWPWTFALHPMASHPQSKLQQHLEHIDVMSLPFHSLLDACAVPSPHPHLAASSPFLYPDNALAAVGINDGHTGVAVPHGSKCTMLAPVCCASACLNAGVGDRLKPANRLGRGSFCCCFIGGSSTQLQCHKHFTC